MKITPEQAREALDAWICRPGMTQEQATILITEAFWALKERPNIDVQRVTDEGGAVDQRALGVNRVKIFERWKAIDTRDKREKFTALVPAIMEAIRISDFRLYREISDGKSITYMIAGLNKEYGDVVESGLLFADPAVVDRETDELIEKAIAFKLAYRQQYQQKAGWNYSRPWAFSSFDGLSPFYHEMMIFSIRERDFCGSSSRRRCGTVGKRPSRAALWESGLPSCGKGLSFSIRR